MKKTLVATNPLLYGTRQLRSGDVFEAHARDAGILVAVGAARYATRKMEPKIAEEDIATLRARYREKVGKRPFHGWDAAELLRRMAEAA